MSGQRLFRVLCTGRSVAALNPEFWLFLTRVISECSYFKSSLSGVKPYFAGMRHFLFSKCGFTSIHTSTKLATMILQNTEYLGDVDCRYQSCIMNGNEVECEAVPVECLCCRFQAVQKKYLGDVDCRYQSCTIVECDTVECLCCCFQAVEKKYLGNVDRNVLHNCWM